MLLSGHDHARLRKPRKLSTQCPDSETEQPTLCGLKCSKMPTRKASSSAESRSGMDKMPRRKKGFMSMNLRGLGCKETSSSSMTAPTVIRSAAQWESKQVRKNRQRRKTKAMNSRTPSNVVVVDVPDVCCAPPGIGSASDVAPRSRITTRHMNQREHTRAVRRTMSHNGVSASHCPASNDAILFRSLASAARQRHRYHHQSTAATSEILLLQDVNDEYEDWRLNIDTLSYEELLDLGDRIGIVSKGLREEEILNCLRDSKHSILESPPTVDSIGEWRCSICQEGCRGSNEIGQLECGHYHHIDCIKQWLLLKNICPICKNAALAKK